MLEQSEQSVLLLDASKLTARGTYAIAPVKQVSLLLADGITAEAGARLSELGATVCATTIGQT